MAKVKFIFIVNDRANESLKFIKKHKKISESISTDFKDDNYLSGNILGNLMTYKKCYEDKNCLFFDDCTFKSVKSKHDIVERLSSAINKKNVNIRWVFIKIAECEKNKTYIMDTLLSKYETKEEKTNREKSGNKTPPQINFMNFGKTIILNKCFIDSRYTVFGENISHEVINCFKADDGFRYLYLCSSGSLNRDYFDCGNDYLPKSYLNKDGITYLDCSKKEKDEKKNVQYILLRKAENIKVFNHAFDDNLDAQNYNGIKYAGKTLIEIFKTNFFSRDKDNESIVDKLTSDEDSLKTYISFKTTPDKVFVPKDIEKAICDIKLSEELKGSSMRRFIIEGSSLYNKLKDKIDKLEWEEEQTSTAKDYIKTIDKDYIPNSILGIVDQTNKETYYSDLISYAFAKSDVALNKFLEKCGVGLIVDRGKYTIERENKNIDIFIKNSMENNNFLIVIENKINADFNKNEKKEWKTFVNKSKKENKLVDDLEEKFKEHQNKNPNQQKGQLTKYYLLANYIANKNGIPDDKICFLIVCPRSNVKTYEKDKNDYLYGEKYEVKSYKLIKESIEEAIKSDTNLEQADKDLLAEIANSLAVHAIESNVLFVSRNKFRFGKRIEYLKELDNQQKKNNSTKK